MALINRPLTEDEARRMIQSYRAGWPKLAALYDVLYESAPHVVRYQEQWDPHFTYTSPASFYWSKGVAPGPSDCVWIVPGTEG